MRPGAGPPELGQRAVRDQARDDYSAELRRHRVADHLLQPGALRDGAEAEEVGEALDASGLVGSDLNGDYPMGGDVITAINGEPVRTSDDLIGYLVEKTRPGDSVRLDVIRSNGNNATVDVTLTSRPDPNVVRNRPS